MCHFFKEFLVHVLLLTKLYEIHSVLDFHMRPLRHVFETITRLLSPFIDIVLERRCALGCKQAVSKQLPLKREHCAKCLLAPASFKGWRTTPFNSWVPVNYCDRLDTTHFRTE